MPKPQISALTPGQLLGEIRRVSNKINHVAATPEKIGAWDKAVWALGASLIVASIATGGALTPVAMLIHGAGTLIIAADAGKKVSELKGEQQITAELDRLLIERAALVREYKRKVPGSNPPL
jgi:hypothetical protein